MELQELITLGRHIFSNAPGRLEVFKEINGKRTAKDLAEKLKRHVNNVNADLRNISDAGLIQERLAADGTPVNHEGFAVYEKIPLARTVPIKYFEGTSKRPARHKAARPSTKNKRSPKGKFGQRPLRVPTENEILDICKKGEDGEDQIYEFKGQGTELRKVTKVISAMLNTSMGGILFFGVQNDGTIEGSGLTKSQFDQSFQNSLHNCVKPSANVQLSERKVLGNTILILVAPPRKDKEVYYYEGRVYIRKGTNVLVAGPEDIAKLHSGKHII